jgi:hypothetical protein
VINHQQLWRVQLTNSTVVQYSFQMPKVKCSSSVKLHGFIKEFGDKYFRTDGEILFCKMCEVKVTADKLQAFIRGSQRSKWHHSHCDPFDTSVKE